MSFRTRTLLPIGLIVISTFVQCNQPAIPELPKYTGDLPVLQSHGKLRVIVPPEPLAHIPKQAEPVTIDYDLARDLAEELNLELMLVKAENYAQMVQKLLEGEGDIVAASLTITAARQEQAAFSVPYLYVDEYLITAARDSLPTTIEDLAGMKIGVRRSSSHYQTLLDIQQKVPSLQIHAAPEKLGARTPRRRHCPRRIRGDRIRRALVAGGGKLLRQYGYAVKGGRKPPDCPDDAAR